MIFRTVLSSALFAVAALTAAHADTEGQFERTLQVSGQPDLYVSSGSGTIRIHPGSDSEIHVTAHIHAGWNGGGDIDERIRRIAANPPVQQSGSTIHIGETAQSDRTLYNNISIDYDISTPRATALNLRTGSGDIEVDDLGRFLKAETGSGSVRAHGISGPAELHTGSGDIEVQQRAAGDVKATTGSGSIRAQGFSGAFTARTGSGDIEGTGTLAGSSNLQTGSGSIRLHLGPNAHYNIDAATGSGTIRVAGAQSGSSERHHLATPVNGGGPTLQAHSGSGDIEVN